ncbi:type II toxin-antitoxin system HipA family toxin [Bradyrhizobium sp. S69]|uniref:type II toxin-antitoxin system HipA family toxin n=1 Tax=Bradyrhizobium sp. S69 TaxID=1641856 RepID=UPI00131D342B|nr:type II toxin-antitoxin system HipA family toxin [Bradyrhizobium sp. S69]
MLRVWVDGKSVGTLDRFKTRGSTFAYDPATAPGLAVSVTMPSRTASWDTINGLAPVFEMNLPEGVLRERLMRQFAKTLGSFDNFDLLSLVGETQIGRLRYSEFAEPLSEDVPFQSIEEILESKGTSELFDYLIEKFAIHSGLSGVQPKVMIRAEEESALRHSSSFKSATHIVKFWDPAEYPELAVNEFFCLEIAKRLKFAVPEFSLSESGHALVIKRFDLGTDGTYFGFEDFCVLNGLPASRKYDGGYETRLFGRTRQFIRAMDRPKALTDLFRLFVLNCAIRNGDAHLKNFGIIYSDVEGAAQLAPVYDLITTTAYIPADVMALTLEGSKKWPDRRALIRLGQTRADLGATMISRIFEETADVISDVSSEAGKHFKKKSKYPRIGERILAAWRLGVKESLGLGGPT